VSWAIAKDARQNVIAAARRPDRMVVIL